MSDPVVVDGLGEVGARRLTSPFPDPFPDAHGSVAVDGALPARGSGIGDQGIEDRWVAPAPLGELPLGEVPLGELLRDEAGLAEAPTWAAEDEWVQAVQPAPTGTSAWSSPDPPASSPSIDHIPVGQPSGGQPSIGEILDAEAEAFLGGLWDSAKSMWEQTLVKTAVARGQRDEGKLTDLVFFRRHPERNGRPLSRSEPGFAQLAAEWTEIRDTIVRPAIRGDGRGPIRGDGRTPTGPPPEATPGPGPLPVPPTPGPGGGESGDPAWAGRRRAVVAKALAELSFWGAGTLRETEQRGWERIERYWMESVGWTPSDVRGRALATGNAWSGVFISWVVAQAGVGRDLWSPWSNHSGYMVKLLRMQARSGHHPITVVPPYSVPLRPGDMVNNWRDSSNPYDLDELRRWVPRQDLPRYYGHTDIVTEVVPGSHAVVVGGNKGDSVKRADVRIDGNGVLTPQSAWVAVIRMGP